MLSGGPGALGRCAVSVEEQYDDAQDDAPAAEPLVPVQGLAQEDEGEKQRDDDGAADDGGNGDARRHRLARADAMI